MPARRPGPRCISAGSPISALLTLQTRSRLQQVVLQVQRLLGRAYQGQTRIHGVRALRERAKARIRAAGHALRRDASSGSCGLAGIETVTGRSPCGGNTAQPANELRAMAVASPRCSLLHHAAMIACASVRHVLVDGMNGQLHVCDRRVRTRTLHGVKPQENLNSGEVPRR